jgi:hypothetical protein
MTPRPATAASPPAANQDAKASRPSTTPTSSMPRILGKVVTAAEQIIRGKGVDVILTPPLSEDEADSLRRAADTVRGAERSLGI